MKPRSSWNTQKAKEKPTIPARISRPPPITVGSFFQPQPSPAAAIAKSATKPPRATVTAPKTANPTPIPARKGASKPPDPHESILKPANSRTQNATQAQIVPNRVSGPGNLIYAETLAPPKNLRVS